MIEGIGHIGIIVKNLDEAVNLYCELFSLDKPTEVKEWPIEGMRHVMLKVGEDFFEVMEPYPGTALAKFVEQHGEGLHHINLKVRDGESFIMSLKSKGAKVIDRGPKSCFVHPKSMKGVLLEIESV
jgi:methylmalonyl-CoA/ethylmalonyl-CoA epimerase